MDEKQTIKKLELLAPAGSYETFRAVINAGADAVYLGGCRFGARAYADNFSEDELLNAIDDAHIHGRKVYLTVNTLFKEKELEQQLYCYLLPYYRQGLDAVIVQDMGAFSFIHREFPGLSIHTSTQMTVTGSYGAEYMKKLGADRVVLARELSFAEIKDIREKVEIELEGFVHGALCYCYSGQCLLSSMLGGRSGNRGRCAQPCRLPYAVCDEKGKTLAQKEGMYILSPKDLCTVSYIPELAECGIHSFKIEGRMKQAEYAAGVVSVYRHYLDRYLETLASFQKTAGSEAEARKKARDAYAVDDGDLQKLWDLGNRSGFTGGYYSVRNGKDMITLEKPNHTKGSGILQSEIRKTFVENETKEKIKGILKLKKDFPATIELQCGDIRVSEEGDIVQPSIKQPLSREKTEACMKKTGNTPFVFETLQVEADEDIFLPVQALNRLRRDALIKLSADLTEKYRREAPPDKALLGQCAPLKKALPEDENREANLAVSIESRTQLDEVLSFPEVGDVYLSDCCYTRADLTEKLGHDVEAVHRSGKRAFYMLPVIFRRQTAEFYEHIKEQLKAPGTDGIVAGSYDAAEFVRTQFGAETALILDHSLYTYNNRARECLNRFKPLRDTAPLELNRQELMSRENSGTELLLYGRLPLMRSVQCIHANTKACDKKPGLLYVKDRYGKCFPVRNNCAECYNTIYNTVPLVLFGFRKDFEKMGMRAYRISFTTEEKDEVHRILELYREVFQNGRKDWREAFLDGYTNGHYKRGVE